MITKRDVFSGGGGSRAAAALTNAADGPKSPTKVQFLIRNIID